VAPDARDPDADLHRTIKHILDPVLAPLGFASGQVGDDGRHGQAIFCRGDVGSPDGGCIDLVLDVEAMPDWRITGVRYWGFLSDRWQLDFERDARLADQLAGLAETLPRQLA
jgi:hypothetical protein